MTWLTNLDTPHLMCRKLLHAWKVEYWYRPAIGAKPTGTDTAYPYQPPPHAAVAGDRILVLRCNRCTAWRFDHLDEIGWLVRRKYQYPDGYLRPTEEPKPTGQDLSLALLDRVEIYEPPEPLRLVDILKDEAS